MKLGNLLSKEVYAIVALTTAGLSMHIWGADEVLDTKLFYTVIQADFFFENLEPLQWRAYVTNEAFDFVFLLSYSLLFFFLADKFYSNKSWLAFVPGILDLLETATIILLLLNREWSVPFWLGYVTCFKWLTGAIVVIWISVGFAKFGRRPRHA